MMSEPDVVRVNGKRLLLGATVVLLASVYLTWLNVAIMFIAEATVAMGVAGLALLLIAAAYLALSPVSAGRIAFAVVGTLLAAFMWYLGLWLVLGLFGAIGVIVASLAALRRKSRAMSLKALAFFAALAAGTWIGTSWGRFTWIAALQTVPAQAEELVQAIREHEREKGRPPEHLEQLVPEFIASIPPTGLRSSEREYQWGYMSSPYQVESYKREYGTNLWVLEVRTGARGRGFLKIAYFPNQDYRRSISKRVGEWAIDTW